MSPSVASPPPPSTASVPSHPASASSAASPPSSLPQITPPQASVGTFATPATTTYPSTSSSPNAGAAPGGSLANLFNYPGPVSSSSSSSTNASSSTPASTVEVSPLTSSEGFERAPSFPGNLAGASGGAPRSSIPILPVGPGGFGRHREMVYSRPISRPSSAQSWNDEKVPEGGAGGEREGGEWQATVRGPPAPPTAQGGLSVPRSSSVAGGLVVHPPGTPSVKPRHRPHSFHAGMQETPRFDSGDRDATIRGPPGGGGGAPSNYPISEYLADPTLFDGALQTATPGLPTGGSGGSEGTGGAQQQAYYHQMQHQQQRGHPSSSERPRHGQSPPQQGAFYPPPPPQHRSASYSHSHHPPPPAPYYPERGLRHSQPNIHPSSSSYNNHIDPHHYSHPPPPRADPRDPRAAYAQQQQQHHQLATPQHQGYASSSSYGQQMPSRSGPSPVHQRPSLPFPINSPATPPTQHRSHSMNSAHPSSTPSSSLDPSSLQPGSSYRTHPDGSDWSTSSAGEGDSAGEYSYSSTSPSGAEGEDGEMKDLDELDEEVDIMRVYQGPGPSSYVGGAIAGGGPDGLMRMQSGEYSDEEDDHAIDPRDPQYANATRYRGSGPSRSKRESVSSSHYGPPPSSRQYYTGPSGQPSYPYGGSSLPTYLNSSPPPQPMYPISAYGLVAPQGGYQGYPPAPMHHHGALGGSQRKPRLVKTSKIPAPIPVPHLNKRSRGRHVPIDPKVVRSKKGGNGRVYECMVTECGKCFGRSEHLKRHIRSLHTNEKPFPCPHPTCTKEFSRHDNLNQHFRIHLASATDQAAMEGLDMAGLGIVGTRLGNGGPDTFGPSDGDHMLMERQRSI